MHTLKIRSKHKFECIEALQTCNRNLLVMTPGVWKMILIKLKKPSQLQLKKAEQAILA